MSDQKLKLSIQPKITPVLAITPKSKPEPKLQLKPKIATPPKVTLKSQPKLQLEAQLKPQSQTKAQAESKSQTEPQTQAQPEPRPEPQPKSRSKSQSQTEAQSQSRSNSQSQTEAQSQSKSQSQTEAQSRSQTEPEPESRSKPETRSQPLIYVLTRTSRRPNFFHQNVLSVQAQTYPYIKQIVSYDDDETAKYVKKYPAHILESYRVSKKKNIQSIDSFFPFNLYLNELIEKIPEKDHPHSWIMFLDDDDVFTRKDSVEQMVRELDMVDADPNRIVMWQVQFPNRLVPKNVPKTTRAPSPGNVSCIGFAFHISQYIRNEDVRFQPRKGGDQLFIRSIWKHVIPLWVSARANYTVPDELKIRFRKAPPGDSMNRVTLSRKNENIKLHNKKEDLKEKQKKTPSRYQRKPTSDDLSDDPLQSNVWTRVNYERNRTIASGKCNDMRFDSVQSKEYKMFFQDSNTQMDDDTISSNSTANSGQHLTSLLLGSDGTSQSPSTSEEEASQEVEGDRNYYYDSQSQSDEDEYDDDQEDQEDLDQEDQDQEDLEQEDQEDLEQEDLEQEDQFQEYQDEEDRESEISDDNYSEPSRQSQTQMIDLMNGIMKRMYTIQANMESAMLERLRVLESENLKKIIREVIQEELPKVPTTTKPRQKRVHFAKPGQKQVTNPKAILQKMAEDEEEYDREDEELEEEMNSEEVPNSEEEMNSEEGEEEVILNSEDHQLNEILTGYADIECNAEEPELENEQAFLLQPFQEYVNTIFILNLGGKAKELQYKFEQIGFKPSLIQIVDGNSKRTFYDNMLDLARLCKKKKLKKVAIFQDGLILHRNFTEELVLLFEQIQAIKKWKLIALTAAQNLVTKGADLNPEFYRNLYPDLDKAKLKTDQQIARHWKAYGSREKRYPNRGVFHPDHLTGVSGVLLSSQIYSDLDKLKKAHLRMGQYMVKSYPKELYAVTPLLGLNGMNRTVRLRNKHNINLYEEA